MLERWTPVKGYEQYQVSTHGRVKRNKVLKRTPSGGYATVKLCKDGVCRTFKVCVLVLTAFVGPADGREACHGDGDRLNDNLDNLRWNSRTGNQRDRRRHGTDCGRSVKRGDGKMFPSLAQAAESVGTQYQSVWAVCNGRRPTAGGHTWEYA